MSTKHFQSLPGVVLLLMLSSCSRNSGRASPISLTIEPIAVTVQAGEAQKFGAVIQGADNAGIQWQIQEPDGGRIAQDGSYVAPKVSGIYHVVATLRSDPATKAVAKVTVVGDGEG